MLWHQFGGTPMRRVNDWISWSVLVLTPLTVILLLLLAPDALSIWFWPVAIVATVYAFYSTLIIRYQIRTQAATLLAAKPALLHTTYQVHEKGVKMISGDEKLFLPWAEIERVREVGHLFLLFVSNETLLIVPKRSLPDEAAFRHLLRHVHKLA